tara:strand:+ start:496 stop:900 length:405 start_codon:yes stop_codon:yes gene_type:complete
MIIRLPTPDIPTPPDIPAMEFKPPSAQIPYFPPIVIPPANLERPPGVKAEETETTEPETPKLNIPIIDIEFPLPETTVVVTAVTTAVVAVATTTVAQTFFEPIKKNVQKQLQKRVDAWKKKRKEKDSSKNLKTE